MRYQDITEYRPTVRQTYVYCPHPGETHYLKYNHDADVVRFKGRYIAAWNANAENMEGIPGQYNFIAYSDDFMDWTAPELMFFSDRCVGPVDDVCQWCPIFINFHDEILFCAWCTTGTPRTFISHSTDGVHWTNVEVETAPDALRGQVFGFPTNHGFICKDGRMIFPCSLPYPFPIDTPTGSLYNYSLPDTEYTGLLMSDDGGEHWHWSQPIRTADWADFGESAAERDAPFPRIWEPSVFEEGNGRLGLIVRNSTAQGRHARIEKPHQMLYYCYSDDRGETFTPAYPVELHTVSSRSFAVSDTGDEPPLYMLNNDNHVRVPQPAARDRYHMALFVAPIPDPDLLLPGPVVQPELGTCCYPNGFLQDGGLYFTASYRGVIAGIVEALPDFSRPFLLPRDARRFLTREGDMYRFASRTSSLGLVLTAAATRADTLTLRFRCQVAFYSGEPFVLLTVGGTSRDGFTLTARYDPEAGHDVIEAICTDGTAVRVGNLTRKQWMDIRITLDAAHADIQCDDAHAALPVKALRKLSFGGLYEKPIWEEYTEQASFVYLDRASISIEHSE